MLAPELARYKMCESAMRRWYPFVLTKPVRALLIRAFGPFEFEGGCEAGSSKFHLCLTTDIAKIARAANYCSGSVVLYSLELKFAASVKIEFL